jgi:hypothetical protein
MVNGVVLYPARSLVRNVGVDGSGTHGGSAALHQELSSDMESTLIRFPDRVETDEAALARVAADLRALRPGLFTRLVRRLVA